jgi:hypothetical protein
MIINTKLSINIIMANQYIELDFIKSFIIGLIDADGCVAQHKHHAKITNHNMNIQYN